MIIKYFPTEADMLEFADQFAKAVVSISGLIIFLYGPLGAGKTTLTRGILRGLGYRQKVKSPTYTLVEPYEVNGIRIFHFDFYRLEDPKELEYIGIQDYFSLNAICLIEWPEKGAPLLPTSDLSCYISFKDQGRELCLEAHSELGKKILERL